MKQGIIIAGHGSRNSKGQSAFINMVNKYANRHPNFVVEFGFLEFQQPTLVQAFENLIDKKIEKIFVVPAFIFTGIHIQTDIPVLFKSLTEKYHEVEVCMADCIGVCPQLVQLCDDLITEIETSTPQFNRTTSSLLMVGVGASFPEANADFAKLTRLVWENSGFTNATYAFVSSIAFPNVLTGLEQAELFNSKSILVCPVLLFPGAYQESIIATVKDFSSKTEKQIFTTEILGEHELLLDAMDVRLTEAIAGKFNMLKDLPRELLPRRVFS